MKSRSRERSRPAIGSNDTRARPAASTGCGDHVDVRSARRRFHGGEGNKGRFQKASGTEIQHILNEDDNQQDALDGERRTRYAMDSEELRGTTGGELSGDVKTGRQRSLPTPDGSLCSAG